ncbi:MAG TPA: DUF3565 domain-containing protein [Gammaproteobacteria bacterium]|nr:DUF3565 domain-containing protein [Gammaproteobacteria bacterium]
MQRHITGYHLDDDRHWVAELECGHNQHVRHQPPWINRPWTQTEAGRNKMLGAMLGCKKCDNGAPPDR